MKKLLLTLTLGILLAATAFLGTGTYRNHKEKRFTRQAEQFLEQGELAKAALSSRLALNLNTNNLPAHRVMAFIAETEGSSLALHWRRRIAELEPTIDNQIILAACALRFEPAPYPTAVITLNNLGDKASKNPAFHVVASRLALQMNDRARAEQHLQTAITLDPENESNRLNLAALRLRSQGIQATSEARRTLRELRSSEQFGADALRWLIRDAEDDSNLSSAIEYSNELLTKKSSHENDRFIHLTLLAKAKSKDFEAFLNSTRSAAGNEPDEIYRVVAWQIALDLSDQALSWIQSLPADVQRKHPVPIARADALGALARWRELSDFLRDEKWGEQEFLRRALLSRALRMQNEPDAAKANWSRSVEAASGNIANLAQLAQLAGKWKWEMETEALLWTIARNHPDHIWALEMINHVYAAKQDTAGLLRVNEVKLRRNPSDHIAKNNVAMISFLLKTNLPSSHAYAEQVYKADPKNAGYVSTHAYSLHLQGKTEEAIKLLEGLDQAQPLRPSVAAYQAILLSAVGDKERAEKFMKMAEHAHLLPEEERLLREAKRKL